jgi:hypothetical protein
VSIKVIGGKILCSKCGKLLEEHETFKINEFQYEIVCIDCDVKYNFSKDNYVNFTTPMKQRLLNIILNAMKDNKTITIDIKEERKKLIDYLSNKIDVKSNH